MQYISWQEWYSKWKDKKPLNEITSDYNCFLYQYQIFEDYENCNTRLGGGVEVETYYLLQENKNKILQQNGSKIVWQIKQ